MAGQKISSKLWERCPTWVGGQGGMESFTDVFSSNLNTLNLKVLPNHGRKYTRRESLDQSTELWKERGK